MAQGDTTKGAGLRAPDGSDIIGTHELVECCTADIVEGSLRREGNDDVAFEHAGETDMNWDEQHTTLFRGKTVFVDDSGEHWHEGQLVTDDAPDTADIPKPLRLLAYNQLLDLVHRIHDQSSLSSSAHARTIVDLIEATGMSV